MPGDNTVACERSIIHIGECSAEPSRAPPVACRPSTPSTLVSPPTPFPPLLWIVAFSEECRLLRLIGSDCGKWREVDVLAELLYVEECL